MKKTNKVLKLMLAVALSFGFSAHANLETVEGSDKFVTLEQFEALQKYIEAKGAENLNLEEKTEFAETSVRMCRETGLNPIDVFGVVLLAGGIGSFIMGFKQSRDALALTKFMQSNPSKEGLYKHRLIKGLRMKPGPWLAGSGPALTFTGATLLFFSSAVKAATVDEYFLTEEGFPKFLEIYQTDEEVRNFLARHTEFRDGLVEQFYAVKGFLEKEEIKAKTEKSEFIFPLLPIFIDYYESTF